MKENDKNIKAKKELRKFGITVGSVFVLLGLLLCWRGKGYYYYFLILGGAFIIPGVIVPMILRPVEKVWMGAAKRMGWVMTRVILSILFFLVFTPMGLVAKLFGKQFLDLKIDKRKKSYWGYREKKEFNRGDYEKQF
jgi:hypothetical protein